MIKCVLLALALTAAAAYASSRNWGDQGDGTYKNPILPADYSDPDVIRVGGDFYLVASEFHFVGIQVLHSTDLVNWSVIGQVFNRLEISPKYDTMGGYGAGTWAPSLRYHNGEFYLYVCTPKEGLFMWHSTNPAGPWSEMVTVHRLVPGEKGWEDPCPFWDDDGNAYLVHGVLGAGPVILHKMSPDGTALLDNGEEVYRGKIAEGPKLFKRKGLYYISLPEGGVENGCQTVLRSANVYGPYERKVVLPAGSPHQGGLVDLENGESWFIGFKSAGFLGRICHLEPVKWGADGWPVFGDNGKPVRGGKKPTVAHCSAPAVLETSDEFDLPALNMIWQWNHNPVNENWSLTERRGFLRLKALPASDLSLARNTITQKMWDEHGVSDVKLGISEMADGQTAGLAFMCGNQFGWIGVRQAKGLRQIAWEGGSGPSLTVDDAWLRGSYDGMTARFSYSTDGRSFITVAPPFMLKSGYWKGARIALFSFGPRPGSADFDYFRYRAFSSAAKR
jgi:beta-xylosidase